MAASHCALLPFRASARSVLGQVGLPVGLPCLRSGWQWVPLGRGDLLAGVATSWTDDWILARSWGFIPGLQVSTSLGSHWEPPSLVRARRKGSVRVGALVPQLDAEPWTIPLTLDGPGPRCSRIILVARYDELHSCYYSTDFAALGAVCGCARRGHSVALSRT